MLRVRMSAPARLDVKTSKTQGEYAHASLVASSTLTVAFLHGPKAWHDMVGHSMHAPDKTVASCR